MKLEYGTEILGDDSVGDSIVDHGGDHARVYQREDLAGGSAPFLAGKGNHSNDRSFTVDKIHDTAAEAVAWYNNHPDELPASGTLRISEGSAASEMSAVLVSVTRFPFSGRTTLLRYNFTGKQLTAGV